MIKIKVSYENEKELNEFLNLIYCKIKKIKIMHNSKGKYKKAYVIIKEHLKWSVLLLLF